jgi:hypothetical protein
MIVMTGGRVGQSASSSTSASGRLSFFWSSTSCSSPGSTRRSSAPSSVANSSIWTSESDWVAVTISPMPMRNRTTSDAVRLNLGPRSCAVDARSTTMTPSGTGASRGV